MFIFSCLLPEILQQSKYIAEKEEQLTEIKSKLNQEEEQQQNLTDIIQELKEELTKKMESKKGIISKFS